MYSCCSHNWEWTVPLILLCKAADPALQDCWFLFVLYCIRCASLSLWRQGPAETERAFDTGIHARRRSGRPVPPPWVRSARQLGSVVPPRRPSVEGVLPADHICAVAPSALGRSLPRTKAPPWLPPANGAARRGDS